MNERNFNAIPANACLMSVGEFVLGDNGENAKTAPISLVARSGKAIEHWFWGKVVHDLSGVRLSKPRVAIDYVHDEKEVIGYLNHFDSTSGDFVTSGALVPFKDSDRATEILFKVRAGVPYQASINFGGDGIKIEELMSGMVAQVNGYQLEGPAVIIREWPLRGVAICPYGADENTESRELSNSNKTFSATVASASVPITTTPTEEAKMSDPVEVVATGTETAQATETEQKPEEATATEAQAVEVPAVETEEKPQEQQPPVSTELASVQAEIENLKHEKLTAEKELSVKTEIAKLSAEKETLLSEMADLKRKLSAYQKGETVLSSTSNETKTSGSFWADAQKRK